MTVIMQAVSSSNGQAYQWNADDWDAGAGFPGPGSATHVVQIAGLNNTQASATMPIITPSFVYQRTADGTGVEGRPMPVYDVQVPPTLDPADIQAALDIIPSTGGNIYIPPGTWVLTENLHCYGKSNVRIFGAGMGRTQIIVPTGVDRVSNPNWLEHSGAISLSSHASGGAGDAAITNIHLSDLTIWDQRASSLYPPGDPRNGHLLALDNCQGVFVDRCEFRGGAAEVVYITCNPAVGAKDLNFLYNWFHDSLDMSAAAGSIDTNTSAVDGLNIIGNRFDEVSFAVAALGDNVHILYNKFHRVQNYGIEVTESVTVPADHRSGAGLIVAHNTFTQLGYNNPAADTAVSIGIMIANAAIHYADGTEDIAPVVAHNTFVDSIASGMELNCIRWTGPASLIGNVCGGILADGYNADCSDQAFSYHGLVLDGTASRTTFSGNKVLAPEIVIVGSVLLSTAGLYGSGGTLAGKTLIFLLSGTLQTLTFPTGGAAYADATALLAGINAVWPGRASQGASGGLVLQGPRMVLYAPSTAISALGLAQDSYRWRTGILMTTNPDHKFYCDGSNDIDVGGEGAQYAILFGGSPSDPYPEISLNGDRLGGRFILDRQTTYNIQGELDHERVYGRSGQVARTLAASNPGSVIRNTGPTYLDVGGLTDVYVVDAAPSTLIYMQGGLESQIVRLHFTNGNTTIQHNGTYTVLDGAVDVVSAAGGWIELQQISAVWREMRRKGMAT